MKKIVIQVNMDREKCRSKALKIAAAFPGVLSVSLEGESRDRVVVTGEVIDSVCLTNKLRKKFSYATLLSVLDANAYNNEGGEAGWEDETTSVENLSAAYCCCAHNYPPPCPSYHVVYDPYPIGCSIL